LLAAIITFLSVRMSDQPADEKHPYGHGKFENFSAFVETGLLALTALYIVYEAFDRLFFRSVHIQPSLTAMLVLLVALSIDVNAGASPGTCRAKIFQRRPGSRRTAFFYGCVEHHRSYRRHRAGVGR